MEKPAVSVIIPMYNVEKYIGECLDSILNQTFQNFEVIVVDDCSTDNSAALVESYVPKFGGRLILAQTNKNCGRPGIPRNMGLAISHGEYVYFVDADDMLTKTALEELYTLAKQFNAEIVYMGARYHYSVKKGAVLKRDAFGRRCKRKGITEKPKFTADNPKKVLDFFTYKGGFWTPWTKFVQRDFLVRNNILFPDINRSEDFLWMIEMFCYVKRFLRIPNAVYLWRDDASESITRKKRNPEDSLRFFMTSFAAGANHFDKLIDKIELLQKNSASCYEVLNRFLREFMMKTCFDARMQVSSQSFHKILREEFKKIFGEYGGVIAFLCSAVDAREKTLSAHEKRIAELENEINRLKAKE